ncbi:MAG: S-layer homology domain-containing protein [Oscillospiraceae bacterium]
MRALGLSQEKTAEFTDVLQSDWFCGFVGAASKAGIVNGVGNGKFNPQGAITREQAATMLARASKTLGLSGAAKDADSALKAYPDAQAASSYAKDALAFCAEHNILESDRTELRPGEAICRCEVAQMVWNLLAAAGEV